MPAVNVRLTLGQSLAVWLCEITHVVVSGWFDAQEVPPEAFTIEAVRAHFAVISVLQNFSATLIKSLEHHMSIASTTTVKTSSSRSCGLWALHGLARTLYQSTPRFGLRFADRAAMVAFAGAKQLEVPEDLGIFAATGLPSTVNVVGLHDLLHPRGWQVSEFICVDVQKVVFSVSRAGYNRPLHRACAAGHIQIRIGAKNATARRLQQEA
eukprot:5801788-Amphidinium_carterae.1